MTSVLNQLDQLQKKIFSIYLKRDYAEKMYLYEKDLHALRLKIFASMLKIHDPKEDLNHLFEIITALGNLRYRINDHTTFEVCEKELAELSKSISEILQSKRHSERSTAIQTPTVPELHDLARPDKSQLLTNIEAFEKIYATALQVVTKNPIFFLIFIQNLFALQEVIDKLNREKVC